MKRCRVLIIDDDSRSRDGLISLLTTVPEIEVVAEAPNGLEAVQLVESIQPDVVVIDILMPEMDGIEATQLIKKSWPEIAVIVLTVNGDHKEDSLAAGADAFLIKGASSEALLEAICGSRSSITTMS
jgi:DNA-binding NarL/FixJ family response regulator